MRRNGSIFASLKLVFPNMLVSPGVNFFAGGEAAPITLDWEELVERFNSRGIQVPDFNTVIYYTILEPDSVAAVMVKLEAVTAREGGPVPLVNTDSFPVSYYYNLVIWNRLSETKWIKAFDWMVGVRTWWVRSEAARPSLPASLSRSSTALRRFAGSAGTPEGRRPRTTSGRQTCMWSRST